jgi:hypothetical protein
MILFLPFRALTLRRLVKKTREHLNAMGETGAGITSEDQINMDEDNEFMNKWSEYRVLVSERRVLTGFLELIKNSFPWFWEMKVLISERPNVVPVGLGNSESTVDMSGYDAGYKTDASDSKPVSEEDRDEDEDMPEEEEEDDDDEDTSSIRRRHLARKKDNLTTPARKKSSKPNAHPGRDKKSSKTLDRFADLASAEEVTNQKQLDLKRLQSQNAKAKIKAKADVQIHRDKLRAELRMLEKKQEHDFRMAQLNLQIVQGRGGGGGGSGGSGAPRSLLSDFYNNSPGPSQADLPGLFNVTDETQSSHSFSTGASPAFDLESFDYNTPLSSSSGLPPLPPPGNME